MSDDSPAVILYDANGNPLGVVANKLEAKVAQGDAAALAAPWPVRVTDGVYGAGVDAAGALFVSGKSAAGVAPSSNPVLVAGIDNAGLKRTLLTDNLGRLVISYDNPQAVTVEVAYDFAFNAGQAGWWEGLDYPIPSGWKLNIGVLGAFCDDNRATMRFAKSKNGGTYDVPTATFTPGGTYSFPEFASYIDLEVTAPVSGNGNYVITYTNQAGVPGRTATATVANGSIIGRKFLAVLQGTDVGVRQITNATQTGSTAGAVQFNLGTRFAEIRCTAADTPYTIIPSKDTMILRPTEVLDLDFFVNGASNVRRVIRVVGVFEPV